MLNIDTPENVVFGYTVAGIGSRFIAALVDTLIIVLLQLVIVICIILFVGATRGTTITANGPVSGWLVALGSLMSFAFLWGYYIFYEMRTNGQSIGKRIAKIRVIRTDGTPITLTESIVRNLVRLIDFLPAYYAVGVITMFANDQARRLGDFAAGTIVVRESQEAASLETLAPRMGAPQLVYRPKAEHVGMLPVEMLGPAELQMVENFLNRRRTIGNSDMLAQRLLARLFTKMELPPQNYYYYENIRIMEDILRASKGTIRTDENSELP